MNKITQRIKDRAKEQGFIFSDDDVARVLFVAQRDWRQNARRKLQVMQGKFVDHIDGNPLNNSVENLRVV